MKLRDFAGIIGSRRSQCHLFLRHVQVHFLAQTCMLVVLFGCQLSSELLRIWNVGHLLSCLPVGCGKQVRFCLCFGSITQEAPEFLENLRVKAGFFVDFSICEIIRDAFYFRQSQPILPVNFLEVSQVIGTSWYVQSR